MITISYKNGSEKDFQENVSISSQLIDASLVKIDMASQCPASADKFLSTIADLATFLILSPIDIQVKHGDTIAGAKIAKKAKSVRKNMAITWVVKEIVKNHCDFQKKLNDILGVVKEKANA